MNATISKDDAVAKLVSIWESKNAKRAAKGAGLSTMAVSLAACGGSSSTTTTTTTTTTETVDPVDTTAISANMVAANPIITSGTGDANDILTIRPDVLDDVTSITGPFAQLRILHDGVDATVGNGVTVSNVTTVSLEDVNNVATTLDASEMTSITTFKIDDATASVTLDDVQSTGTVIELSDVDGAANTVTIDFDAQAWSATDKVVNISVQEVTQGVAVTGLADANFDAVEITIADAADNAVSTLASLASAGAETITITGGTADYAFGITAALDDATTTIAAGTAKSDLTLNVGTDNRAELTVTLGEGDDTLTTADTLDEDTISGGLGDDTVTAVFDNAGTRTPDMDGVETLDVTFDDSATVDFRNVDDVATVEVRESTARISLERMDATVKAINVYGNQATNHEFDYATGEDGTLTLTWDNDNNDDAAIGTLTFDEMLSLDLVFTGNDDVTGTTHTYDDVDTEVVTIRNTGSGDVELTNFVNTSAVTDLTVRATSTGDIDLGTMLQADALENLTVESQNGADGAAGVIIGQIGNDAGGAGDATADNLDEVTITVGDNAAAQLAHIDADNATLSFISITVGEDGDASLDGDGAGEDGYVFQDVDILDVSVAEGGTVDISDVVRADEITEIDVDGEGTFTMDAGNVITTIDEVDVSGMGDTSNSDINIGGTTSAVIINSGTGTHHVDLGQGAATINLVAADGTDTFLQNTTAAGSQVFTNFETTDSIDLDVSGIEGNDYIAGVNEDLINVGLTTTSVAGDAVSIANLAGATDLDNIADTVNVIHVDGNYANVAAMVDELENGGDYQLTFDGQLETTDLFLVLWDDGTNSYLSAVNSTAQIADSGIAAAGDLSGFNIITFNGIADADDITAAMIGGTFIA